MSTITDIAKDLITALRPQPTSTEPPHVYRWRQAVFLYGLFQGVVQMALIVFIFGLVPAIYAGFTPLEQFNQQRNIVADIRLGQIERNIREAKTALCLAQQVGDMRAVQLAGDAIRGAQTDYWNFTAKYEHQPRYYPEPACEVLIVTKR